MYSLAFGIGKSFHSSLNWIGKNLSRPNVATLSECMGLVMPKFAKSTGGSYKLNSLIIQSCTGIMWKDM